MRKLTPPSVPPAFEQAATTFAQSSPCISGQSESKRWKDFCDTQQLAYETAWKHLHINQQGLCAYCEIALTQRNKQVEHYVPKSCSTPTDDWTLKFSNFLLCCLGGTNPYSVDPHAYSDDPTAKANHSCGQRKDNTDPQGCLLNPYTLPDAPVFRAVRGTDGVFFHVNQEVCEKESIDPQLVEQTIEVLGLNCPRLVRNRMTVWDAVVEEIVQDVYAMEDVYAVEDMYKKEDDELVAIATTHLRPSPEGKLHPYFTTRLWCLAEDIPLNKLLDITKDNPCPQP